MVKIVERENWERLDEEKKREKKRKEEGRNEEVKSVCKERIFGFNYAKVTLNTKLHIHSQIITPNPKSQELGSFTNPRKIHSFIYLLIF
jgi:hypothetical protein